MEKKTIALPGVTSFAPVAPAVEVGGFIFCSGQCGYDMAKGCFYGDDIETQTRGALNNLQAVLHEAGSGMDDVVKVNIYLTDVADFQKVNEIYREYFTGEKPARTCVQVARIPLEALIEIEVIAIKR